jgi:hypothetical protein
MVAMMVAAVPLTATVEEHGLCLSTTSLQQPVAGGGGGWLLVLAVFLVAMVIGIYLGWRLHGWWVRRPATEQKRTQSQTTYTYYNQEPRFKPLAERETGAWAG